MPDDLLLADLPPHRIWARGGDRPVLALHCSLAHSGAWIGLAERLTGITLTATDQIGHGRAADWDGVSDLHASATASSIAMAERLGQGRPIDLMGHSFGGTVALRVALTRPDLVRSLTLVEPVVFAAARGTPVYDRFRTRHLDFARLILSGQREQALRVFHGDWGNGETLETMSERMRTYLFDRIHLIEGQNPVLLDDAAGLLRPGVIEGIRVPVLLVDGAKSPPIIEAVHSALIRRLTLVQRLTVPGAGHMVSITHADAVAPVVQEHLDGC